MTAPVFDAATERVAINLLRHLEWQHDGFSLVFLFADVGAALELANWLDQRLVLQGRRLQRGEVKDSFVQEPEHEVDHLVASFAELSAEPGGVWYAMPRHPRDEAWNNARTLFLARLNERRFLLERDLQRPLVLVLPAHFRPTASRIAPDIWHRRDLSEGLRVRPRIPADADIAERPETSPPARLSAYDQWQRLRAANTSGDRLFLPLARRRGNGRARAGRPGASRGPLPRKPGHPSATGGTPGENGVIAPSQAWRIGT
ncbi:MAG: hypothetical protein L0H73_05300 [Nitrococcus sp.]|nr:hypothetical protein [Nitrococcus sp.]